MVINYESDGNDSVYHFACLLLNKNYLLDNQLNSNTDYVSYVKIIFYNSYWVFLSMLTD